MTTTAIATTTKTAPAAPVVKIPLITLVNALYLEARQVIGEDMPTARVPGLPAITQAGVDAAGALAMRRDLTCEWAILSIVMGMKVKKFPVSTRRLHILIGLAKFLTRAPRRVLSREEWFCPWTMQAASEATSYAATPEEAAGVYAILTIRRAY